MASATPSRKRPAIVAAVEGTAPSPLPISKRARFEASTKTDEEKVWASTVRDIEADDSTKHCSPLSTAPSRPFTDLSIEVASTTSASTSKRAKKYTCEYQGCSKAFDRPVRLQMHTRSHVNERPYVCEEEGCDKTFLRSEHLKRHTKDKHSEEKEYTCTYPVGNVNGEESACSKSFTTATRLRRHVAAHEAKEETSCQEPGCGMVFRKQDTLQRHIKQVHLHEKSYRCSHLEMDDAGQAVECGKSFAKSDQLKNHEAREHAETRYYCEMCPPIHVDEILGLDIELESLVSDADKVGFTTYADLQHHMKTVHPPTCSDCGKHCESNRALKAHIDIEHSSLFERQQFQCTWPSCSRAFTKAGNLKVHTQNVHAKARNFVCGSFDLTGNAKVEGWNAQGCGSAFGTKANLEEHVRTQHLGLPSKLRPCRQKKVKVEDTTHTPSTLMDVDELPTPADGDGGLALLTGFGFEDLRSIACLLTGCPARFVRDYDLAQHLELTHGWNIDDVNDAIAERDALSGDKFWIGGGGEQVGAEEASMRQQLTDMLTYPRHEGPTEQPRWGAQHFHKEAEEHHSEILAQMEQFEGMRVDNDEKMLQSMESFAGATRWQHDDAMPIDPALTEADLCF